MSQSVELEPAEWQQVISALAMTNPVLVKISSQLAQQGREAAGAGLRPGNSGINPSKEPSHGL